MNELPQWIDHRVVGEATSGGWVIKVSNVSDYAKRLEADGWRITPSGARHILVRKREEDDV